MLSLFTRKNDPILDTNTTDWLFDTFAWAIANFDADIFFNKTELILPTNAFFPGKVASVEEMTQTIFDKVKQYALVNNWPITLAQPNQFVCPTTPLLKQELPEQNWSRSLTEKVAVANTLPVTFHPAQINKPQDLIANFAYTTAYYVAVNVNTDVPGGHDALPQAIEVLSVFLGFGIMQVNSAYTFKGGCGSCFNAAANRQASLPEAELIYALAIFCQLKNIQAKQVTPHLKAYLRSDFKKAMKEVKNRYSDVIIKLKKNIQADRAFA